MLVAIICTHWHLIRPGIWNARAMAIQKVEPQFLCGVGVEESQVDARCLLAVCCCLFCSLRWRCWCSKLQRPGLERKGMGKLAAMASSD
jgi:hypothetical protein